MSLFEFKGVLGVQGSLFEFKGVFESSGEFEGVKKRLGWF